VSRAQLAAIGITDDLIAARLRAGWLIRLRHGVYAVGHLGAGADSRHWAALLEVGDGGALSHLSAAAEHRIKLPAPLVVDVTTPRRLPARDGIRIHTAPLDPSELSYIDGRPLTSPTRTLFDLATMLGTASLAKAANEAFVQQLVTLEGLRATLARNKRRKGAVAFRRLLTLLDPDDHRVRSPLEIRLHRFLRTRAFPTWESNARLRLGAEWIEPDVLWRAERVIVEADGRDPHLAPVTFDSDRRRDRRLRVEGWQPVRVTSVDLDRRPDELEADLRALLALPSRQ
jgi:predicted transcriptional regulator of viral defense system